MKEWYENIMKILGILLIGGLTILIFTALILIIYVLITQGVLL